MRLVLSSVGWGFVLALGIAMALLALPVIVAFLLRCAFSGENPLEHVSTWKCVNRTQK